MRKIIVNNIVSIDGRYAALDGNPLALQMDAAFDRANLASIEQASTILLGRNSFDMFSSYWPAIADAPTPEDADAPEARAFDEVNRAISRRYNVIPKLVVSDRGPVSSDNPWAATTKVIPRAEAIETLTSEKQRSDGDIVMFGSHILWNHLLAAGVIDELHLMISPHPLGAGIELFTGPAHLDLLEARTYPDSSNIQVRYAADNETHAD